MTTLSIEYRPVSLLLPYARNSRTHSPAQIAQLAKSIKIYGWTNPILISGDNTIIAGHARVLAAKKLGMAEVPVVQLSHLTPDQVRAYVIADNQLMLGAGWDMDLLAQEMASLGDLVESMGFTEGQIAALLNRAGLGFGDDSTEIPLETTIKAGDIFELGSHRLMCGDSTKEQDVHLLMNGEKAVLVATDPPYGVGYSGADRPLGHGKRWVSYIEMDAYEPYLRCALAVSAKNAPFYQWCADIRMGTALMAWKSVGLLMHQLIVWVKPVPTFTHLFYRSNTEYCLFGWLKGNKPSPSHAPPGSTTAWAVDWEGNKINSGNLHPTQKPIELFARPIRIHTALNDLVYEPFSGSGSCIIAAEKEGRRCYAMEIAPLFCQAAINRWEQYTNRKAVQL